MTSNSFVGEVDKIPERWVDHEPTTEELISQVKIGKAWKGHFVRRLIQARTPGNEVHQKTYECLTKLSQALEPTSEAAGLQLLKYVLFCIIFGGFNVLKKEIVQGINSKRLFQKSILVN